MRSPSGSARSRRAWRSPRDGTCDALTPPRRLSPKSALAWLTTLAAIVAVILAVRHHADEVSETLRRAELLPILGAVALHGLSLVLRSEAWRLGLRAVGASVLPAATIHRANGVAFSWHGAGRAQPPGARGRTAAGRAQARPLGAHHRDGGSATRARGDCVAAGDRRTLEAAAAAWRAAVAVALPVAARRIAPTRPEGSPLRGLLIAAQPRPLLQLAAVMGGVVLVSAMRIALVLLAFDLPVEIDSVAKVVAAIHRDRRAARRGRDRPCRRHCLPLDGRQRRGDPGRGPLCWAGDHATSVLGVAAYAVLVWGPVPLRALARR